MTGLIQSGYRSRTTRVPLGRRALCLLLALLVATGAAVVAQEPPQPGLTAQIAFQQVDEGLEYRHDVRSAGPLSIHVLRFERLQHRWEPRTGLGQGTIFGLEPLDGIVRRLEQKVGRPAVAAINGDFFVIRPGPYQGDPLGVQVVAGEVVSSPSRNSFWVAADGELRLGPVVSKFRVIWPDGKTERPLGLNEERSESSVVLFTPTLGLSAAATAEAPVGTRTEGGRELVLEGVPGSAWLPLRAGETYSARVIQVRDAGNTPLAAGQSVLSIGPKQVPAVPAVQPGDILSLVLETKPSLRGVATAIGGGRILVEHGRVPDVGPPTQPRHPRSMLGWNREYLLLFVIDGRQPALSMGMTYPEMAALAVEYGCREALELDGGGSSTLWLKGRVLNSPSDGKPRALANGLVFFRGENPPPAPPNTQDRR